MEKMLTESEAAEWLQVDVRTLRKLIDTDRLRAVNVGTGKRAHYRIAPADLNEIRSPASPNTFTSPRMPTRRRPPNPDALSHYLPSA
jgi:excisionase family DNA binding protein